MGLRRHHPGPSLRGPGDRGDRRAGPAGEHRTDQHNGGIPAVLFPRPGGDVRPGPGDLAALQVALAAARSGARVLREAGLSHRTGEAKAAGDYVTQPDLSSETAILEVLAREAPGVAVLSEEAGGSRVGTRWAVDPLDGTTNFMRGLPIVGVSVGLLQDGRPEIGVVIAPWLGLEFAVQRG